MASIKNDPDGRGTPLSGNDKVSADAKPSYKSYKKKYRKMRLQFDHRMSESEELHRAEQKAIRSAKRMATENDRLLDLLLDMNDSPQMPFERRFDLRTTEKVKGQENKDGADPRKSLATLIETVPHKGAAATLEQFPELAEDLDPKDPETHPTSFLNAQDIDEYYFDLDRRLGIDPRNVLVENAQNPQKSSPAVNFALRNPISVYNWLRKHAPKTFLQDLDKDKEKDDHGNGDKDAAKKRKSTGTRGGKRQSAAAAKRAAAREAEEEPTESMDWDEDRGHDSHASGAKGKRKRGEDSGYRPKGGASRPTKKRKSGGPRKSLAD